MEIIDSQRDRCKTIGEIIEESKFLLFDEFQIDAKLVEKFMTNENQVIFDAVLDKLNKIDKWNISNIKDIVDDVIQMLDLKLPNFAKPIRVALTGSLSSPSIDLTIYLLGKESCIKRISAARTLIA